MSNARHGWAQKIMQITFSQNKHRHRLEGRGGAISFFKVSKGCQADF
jgi:hypothetical protein